MNISGIRPYAGFYEYNSIKAAELRNQQIAASQEEEPADLDSKAVENAAGAVSAATGQNFTSWDFARTYDPKASYELKGVNSDINSLDVMKVVSDLDKDKVIRQYQYFVGDRKQGQQDQTSQMRSAGESFTL